MKDIGVELNGSGKESAKALSEAVKESAKVHNEPDRELRLAELAAQIFQLARNTLFVDFRFLQRAISHIELEAYCGTNNILFACDGCSLYYDPGYVLARYKEHSNMINRSLLHSLLHCIFHHDWTGREIDHSLWNLATDIAVENTINELNSSALQYPGQTKQQPLIQVIKNEIPLMNAENIYKFLAGMNLTDEDISRERQAFKLDQHSLWVNAGDSAETDEAIEMMRIWQDVSKRMQVELETMHKGQELLCANLQSINRTRRSYAQFMKRFGNHGELMRLSEDEFDNNYYSYGLELYGNVPLIEELEYREQKHIKEFVIAIDTSGSVQGEAVQKFVQRTYELIKSQESFDVRMKLYIIQCDDQIRESTLICSDDELDKYINSIQIMGLGKTDFRPVFAYVDELLEERKLTNLAGLLYFTDGNGTFPTKKPAYDTAFIIHSDEVYPPEVPGWAMRLMLEDDFR